MNIEEILSTAISIPTGDPEDPDAPRGYAPLFWGLPGIGKSSRVKAGARSALLHAEIVFAGTKQPDDFSMPMPDGKGGIVAVPGLPQIRKLIALGEGVLFLDEIGSSKPAVQNAIMSLVLDRYCGDVLLPPTIRMAAAGNPADVATGGWDMQPALANRFLHFNVPKNTRREWLKWYVQEGGTGVAAASDLWAMVVAKWPTCYPAAKALIAGFIERRGDELLHKLPEEGDPARHHAWPSDRTWEMAGRAYATCNALGRKHLALPFVQAAVGEGAAREFASWVQAANLPTAEEMLQKGWTPSKNRLDIAIAAYTQMTAHVVKHNNPKEQRDMSIKAWLNLQTACEFGLSDIALSSAQSLINADLANESDEQVFEAARPVIRRMLPFTQVI